MKLIYSNTSVIAVIGDKDKIQGPRSFNEFNGTREEILIKIASLQFPFPDSLKVTLGERQMAIFQSADPKVSSPFVKFIEPLTALNQLNDNYKAAKIMIKAVTTSTPEQEKLKQQILNCYAN